jgi:myosin heavy subunit
MTFARQQTPDTLLIEQIKSGKANAVYKECRDAVDVGDVHTLFQKYKEAIKLRDDFGTPLFVKYIGVKIRQIAHLKHHKGIIASYRNRVLAMRKELVDKVNAIEELNEKLSKLEKEQSSVVLLLAEKTQEIQQAKRELSKLTSENKKLSTQNTILSSNVSEKQRQILFMEEKLRRANNEITRLQNISWFQKLLGHK